MSYKTLSISYYVYIILIHAHASAEKENIIFAQVNDSYPYAMKGWPHGILIDVVNFTFARNCKQYRLVSEYIPTYTEMFQTIWDESGAKILEHMEWNEKDTIIYGPIPFNRQLIDSLKHEVFQEYYTFIPNLIKSDSVAIIQRKSDIEMIKRIFQAIKRSGTLLGFLLLLVPILAATVWIFEREMSTAVSINKSAFTQLLSQIYFALPGPVLATTSP